MRSRSLRSSLMITDFSLSLEAAAGNTVDDVLAGEEEEDEHRQDDDGRRSHHDFIAGAAFGHEVIKTEWQRADIGRTGSQHRPQEAVPGGDGIQQNDRHQRRLRDRHHHAPEVLPVRAPVHPGRLIKRIRDRIEEVLQNIGIEDTGHEGDDHRPERVMDPPFGDRAVVRDDEHFKRDHHHRQQRAEDSLAAREAQPGKGECTDDRRECTDGDGTDDHDHGVDEVAEKRRGLERENIVIKVQRSRQPFGRESADFRTGFERAGDHPEEREDHDDGTQHKEEISQN